MLGGRATAARRDVVRLLHLAALFLAFDDVQASPVTLCDLTADPVAYDRQAVEITTFVSHGFEDFTLFDPRCPDADYEVWVEYGGRFASGTIYCCGVGGDRTREKPLVVEDVVTTIVEDDRLRQFDRLVQRQPDAVVRAVLRGRFFAAEKTDSLGSGYGHFGMHSLFVIEEVLSVDPHDLAGTDYRASTSPDFGSYDCVRELEAVTRPATVEQQRLAEAGPRAWAFTDHRRVAAEAVRAKLGDPPGLRLRFIRREQGRITYKATLPGRKNTWWILVSRPYWLTFSAADRRRIAWIAVGVEETGCEGH